ncbi:hypothetical protein V7149_16005 [Bacillus sp. JJ1503]|uniref:hypothetical protein n=1 Tax=Bacillus sp. JJ1503 TaxID=3122956 RepID=UPI002FFDC5A6
MRQVKVFIIIYMIALFLSGCSEPLSEKEFQSVQNDFNELVELIFEKQLDRNDDVLEDGNPKREDLEIETVIKQMERLINDNYKSIGKQQQKSFEEIEKTKDAFKILNSEVLKINISKKTIEKQGKIVRNYVEKHLTEFSVETILTDSILGPAFTNEDIDLFKSQYGIQYDAQDVHFNLSKYLNLDFAIAGKLELSNYYNYGFDDLESNYFSATIQPYDSKYSDKWHLYFHRDSFEDLFDELKNGKVEAMISANIPSFRFEKNQGNMAMVQRASWK